MGAVKQVMPVDGEPMVRKVVRTCLAAGLSPVWVVTGHAAAEVEAALVGLPATVRCVYNPDYGLGQAESLRAGVRAALGMRAVQAVHDPAEEAREVEALAVVLGDQPFVRPETLRRLVELAFAPGALAAAVSYGPDRPGPPCVMRRELWPRVLTLTGDRGARAVLLAAGEQVRALPVDSQEVRDIDAPGDLPG